MFFFFCLVFFFLTVFKHCQWANVYCLCYTSGDIAFFLLLLFFVFFSTEYYCKCSMKLKHVITLKVFGFDYSQI